MDTLIYEPLKYYDKSARERHRKNANDHFDSLVVKSGVDQEANRATVKKYKHELAAINKLNSRIGKYKAGYALLMLLAIIGGCLALFGIYCLTKSKIKHGLIIIAIGAVLLMVGIIINIKVLKPKIKNLQAFIDEHTARANQLLAEAQAQMAPLNALFDDVDTFRLIEKTMPEVKFDRRYSPDRFNSMNSDFDYLDFTDDETSAIDTLSGELFGNPFIFERHYKMQMGDQSYTGALTIHWTERSRDSRGNTVTRHRSQVLTATLVKPRPFYKTDTHLGFGSLAAPDLSFSRSGDHVEDLSEKSRNRKVRRGERKLRKKAQKAITKGKSFQDMTNSEFDVLFGATNRNHEVQFRVMYTPLAQQSTLDLITSEIGYGDDFKFMKQRRYNIIKSEHSQAWQMHVTAAHYRSYDIDEARAKFLSFNENYFKSVFFDFAPLMAVPVYHDAPMESMKTPEAFKLNYTPYEHEVLANSIGADAFKHPDSATNAILKTVGIDSVGNIDRVRVTAYSFAAVSRLDFVPVLGGDGHMHGVPVPWTEYVPLKNITDMAVCALDHSEREFNLKIKNSALPYGTAYNHGLMAYQISHDASAESLKNTFNKFI